MSTGGRPSSGHSAAASHHTHSSSEQSAHQPIASARTATAVALLDTGGDTFDRYKLMFTGPDGVRDHRVKRGGGGEITGIGTRSSETTGNLAYLFRMPKEFPFPRGKHGRLGEIGGEVEHWNLKKGL